MDFRAYGESQADIEPVKRRSLQKSGTPNTL
jgi:hypothetical protein